MMLILNIIIKLKGMNISGDWLTIYWRYVLWLSFFIENYPTIGLGWYPRTPIAQGKTSILYVEISLSLSLSLSLYIYIYIHITDVHSLIEKKIAIIICRTSILLVGFSQVWSVILVGVLHLCTCTTLLLYISTFNLTHFSH